jgi:hypothetical protein
MANEVPAFPKPGILTTEFIVTAVFQVFSALVVYFHGSAPPASLEDAIRKIVVAIGVIATQGWIIHGYVKSRTAVKVAHVSASAANGTASGVDDAFAKKFKK